MQQRLRTGHLVDVLEALIQYAAAGGAIPFISDGADHETRITFVIGDSQAYDARLSQLMRQRLDGVASQDGHASAH